MSMVAPSIKKSLRERANFFFRKKNFYDNLEVLSESPTSEKLRKSIVTTQSYEEILQERQKKQGDLILR